VSWEETSEICTCMYSSIADRTWPLTSREPAPPIRRVRCIALPPCGLDNFLALQLYVQDQSDCSCLMTSKSIQQTRELSGTHEF
jgi:hypothetical protein